MPFASALKEFSESGFFELKNSELSSGNVLQLQRSVEQLKKNQFSKPLGIRLKDIQMLPDVLRKKPDSGPVIQHVPRRWVDGYGDLAISQMASSHGFTAPMNFGDLHEVVWHPEKEKTPLEKLKQGLISLLSQSWSSIELEQLFFYPNHQIDKQATEEFYNELLYSLARNDALKKLTISPFSLSKQIALIAFLQKTKLEHLHLDIIEANRFSWEELCRVLAEYPTLQSLNLGNSVLDNFAHKALLDLLDKNYKTEITLLEPTDLELLKAYQPLKQRLTKFGIERFKEDHLTQDKLFQLAIDTLITLKNFKLPIGYPAQQKQLEKLFDRLVNKQTALAIAPHGKNYIETLPPIFKKHSYLVNQADSIPVLLAIDTLEKNSARSRGSILLEKALETNNQKVMQSLFKANANLFEFPPHEEEPFLVKVLQSPVDIKKLVLDHIRCKYQMVELDLLQHRVAGESKTIGYVLLKKALKKEDLSALRNLLTIKADLFESPQDESEPFLVKVFQSPGELKNCVVSHIRQDSDLIQLASERLKLYPNLLKVFIDLKEHLDKYSLHLVKKDNPSILMFIAYEALSIWNRMLGLQNPSEKRDSECAQIYKDLDESLKAINHDPTGATYVALCEVQKIMHKLKEKSVKALRGIFKASSLHDRAIELVDEFDSQLEANKALIHIQHEERIKQQDKKIEEINLNHAKELTVAKKKQKKLKEENTKLDTENTDLRLKLDEAKVELREMKEKQDQLKQNQVATDEILDGLKAENAKINKKLNTLLKQLNLSDSEDDTASLDPTTNTQFFRC